MSAPTHAGEQGMEHGIELACYSNGPSGYQPRIECSCGWSTPRGCCSWEEAGREFDEHLESAK